MSQTDILIPEYFITLSDGISRKIQYTPASLIWLARKGLNVMESLLLGAKDGRLDEASLRAFIGGNLYQLVQGGLVKYDGEGNVFPPADVTPDSLYGMSNAAIAGIQLSVIQAIIRDCLQQSTSARKAAPSPNEQAAPAPALTPEVSPSPGTTPVAE